MTFRALLLGTFLALLIAALGYLNDAVVRQTYLVGHLLPPAVFGTAVALVLLMRRQGRLALRPGEIVVVAALGLAAAGWASNSFMRHFTPTLGTYWQWSKNRPEIAAQGVLSYLPRGDPRVAPGQVRDAGALVPPVALPADASAALRAIAAWQAEADIPTGVDRRRAASMALRRLNFGITEALFADAALLADLPLGARGAALAEARAAGEPLTREQAQVLSRAVIDAAWPEAVAPMPPGLGLGVTYEDAHRGSLERLVAGTGTDTGEIDWQTWGPPLRLWLPLLLVMGGAAVCLVAVVHPQWANRELLPYPIARFLGDVAGLLDGRSPETGRPAIPPLFWVGFGALLGLHLVNGSCAYLQIDLQIPLTFDFSPLRTLFPYASRAPGSAGVFSLSLYPTMVAFTFFIATSVGVTLGVSHIVWVAFASFWIARGVHMGSFSRFGAEPNNMLLLGAYLGAAAMVLYVGRTYYARLAASAAMLRPAGAETPRYAVWALRVLVLCIVVATVLLTRAGLHVGVAATVVLLSLLLYLVVTRIVAESGMLFIQANWVPAGALMAFAGFEALGPTQLLLVGTASIVLTLNPRDLLMPHVAHGLYAVSRRDRSWTPRFLPLLAGLTLLALLVVVGATLAAQARWGFNTLDPFATLGIPMTPINAVATEAQRAAAQGTLVHAAQATGWDRLALIQPDRTAMAWAGLGLLAYVTCHLLRLKLAWWALHPVLFLIWSTRGSYVFGYSFLLGAMIKLVTLRIGGTRGYASLKPLMIGVIAGEVLAALLWAVIGGVYYARTGLTPPRYLVFPG